MEEQMKVAIIGTGVVGKAMQELFPEAVPYDEPLGLGSRSEVNGCDVAFVCVPTPGRHQAYLDTSTVEAVVEWLDAGLIVIRSTVNPGTTDALRKRYRKRIIFQPEYLGETVAHPMADPHNRPFIILGGEPEDTRMAIEVYHHAYSAAVRIRQTDALTAEMIKLAANRAIAHKVAEVQELYDLCEAAGVDYYTVREAVYQDDPRMSAYWTFVFPDRRGFNSKCIPKDVYAVAAYARELGVPMEVTEALLQRNQRYLGEGSAVEPGQPVGERS
jgi:UDPglucose 6-dehydrogenase